MNIGAARAIMESLSEKDISDLTGYLIQHRLDQVLSGVDDVDSMANNAISTLFSKSNAMSEVSVIAPGIIAIPCYTQYMGNEKKHRCANCTVKNGDQETWCWEQSDTFIANAKASVSNAVRSVSLHLAIPGLRIIRHFMEHNGEYHKRVKDQCFVVVDNGEDENGNPLFSIEKDSEFVAGRLPLPASR